MGPTCSKCPDHSDPGTRVTVSRQPPFMVPGPHAIPTSPGNAGPKPPRTMAWAAVRDPKATGRVAGLSSVNTVRRLFLPRPCVVDVTGGRHAGAVASGAAPP